MTISTSTRTAGPFIGNDTATAFPFAFKVFSAADLLAVQADIDTGVETELTLNSDYSVTLNGDQNGNPGGTLTLLGGALATGQKLVITTSIDELQSVAVTNSSGFYPDVINDPLDLLTVLVQQLRENVARAIALPVTDTESTVALPPAPQRAGRMLGFDVDGNLTLMTVASGGTIPAAQAAAGNIDGANRDFQFAGSATLAPTPMVYVGGVFQTPGVDYGAPLFVAGTTWKVTLTNAPVNGPVTVLLLA